MTGSPNALNPRATTCTERGVSNRSPGKREAALRTGLLVVAEGQVGVDQVTGDALDPVGEDPQPDPQLGGGEAGRPGIQHGVGEVADQATQLGVEVDDGLGGGAQHGVAEQADGSDAHAAEV